MCYLLASEDTIQCKFRVCAEIQDNYPKYVLSLGFGFHRSRIDLHMIRSFGANAVNIHIDKLFLKTFDGIISALSEIELTARSC